MRNLKRALSLALASVMLLGMMVVGSSAKGIDDFTDKAEIVNQDAVAVTSAIGLFDGYEDGSFGPKNVVTRAEMAVIISTMLYGAGVNVNQFAETNVFTDVPAWAQGYVNLCSSLGIVAGVGDGKFDPNATVTTAQAVLMLCRALGYFQSAADRGLLFGRCRDVRCRGAHAALRHHGRRFGTRPRPCLSAAPEAGRQRGSDPRQRG